MHAFVVDEENVLSVLRVSARSMESSPSLAAIPKWVGDHTFYVTKDEPNGASYLRVSFGGEEYETSPACCRHDIYKHSSLALLAVCSWSHTRHVGRSSGDWWLWTKHQWLTQMFLCRCHEPSDPPSDDASELLIKMESFYQSSIKRNNKEKLDYLCKMISTYKSYFPST